jgi:hypothetical protein
VKSRKFHGLRPRNRRSGLPDGALAISGKAVGIFSNEILIATTEIFNDTQQNVHGDKPHEQRHQDHGN